MGEVVIRLAGTLSVLRDGEPVRFGSRKGRRLIARLAARPGHVVGSAELVDELWPGSPPGRPGDAVATIVSRLRAILGPDVVLGGRDGYRLGGRPAARVDLADAEAHAREASTQLAEGRPGLAVAAASRGLELSGDGQVLVGESVGRWLDELRAETAALIRTLRHLLAEAALAAADPRAAVAAAHAAVVCDPIDEPAHRLLMAAYQAAGEPGRALAVYERLRKCLADELGADPAAATRALHLAVLRDAPPPRHAGGRPAAPHARPAPAGREVELAKLADAWSAAAGGRGGAVLVTGEAGIGKTTLAEAAAAFATRTGGRVLRARCYAAERSLFLQPVLDALGPALRTRTAGETRLAGPDRDGLAVLLTDVADALDDPATDRITPELARRRLFDAVTGTLLALAADRPTVLLLDDLHNAGVATAELLHLLVRRSTRVPLLVMVTVRSEEGAGPLGLLAEVADRVDVGPLAADAVALLAARAGSARLAEDILRRTRGHTLFVVETLRALRAGEQGLPYSLTATVLARLRQAGPDVERVLRAGAVLGPAVAPDLAAAMLGLPVPEIIRLCEHAASMRLLVASTDVYEFVNDLVQEIVYETTPGPTRIAHHRRAAELLVDRPEAAAGHADAVGDWPSAARFWLAAGELALGRYAAADAEALLGRGLRAAQRLDDRRPAGRIHIARARAREALAAVGPGVADLEAALDAARDAGDPALEMAALRLHDGDVAPARWLELADRLDTGLRLAIELDDAAAQADFYGWQAVIAANRLRFVAAVELGRRAVAAARRSGSDAALAAGLDGLKTARAYLGDTAALRPVLAELEPLLRRRGDLRLLWWTVFESALPAVAAADWGRAVGLLEESLAINRRSGFGAEEPWIVAHLGWVARLRGRFDEAADLGRRAVTLVAGSGHDWWRSAVNAALATTLLEIGATDDAVALLVEARAAAVRGGAEAYLLRSLAPLAEATGDPDVIVAAEVLLAGIHAPVGCAWLAGGDSYLAVARARLHRGEPDRARSVLAPLLTAADRHGWLPWCAAGALLDGAALAAQGAGEAAGRRFRLAEDIATRHGMPHLAERARALLPAG